MANNTIEIGTEDVDVSPTFNRDVSQNNVVMDTDLLNLVSLANPTVVSSP
jgi:hypothetical protein